MPALICPDRDHEILHATFTQLIAVQKVCARAAYCSSHSKEQAAETVDVRESKTRLTNCIEYWPETREVVCKAMLNAWQSA